MYYCDLPCGTSGLQSPRPQEQAEVAAALAKVKAAYEVCILPSQAIANLQLTAMAYFQVGDHMESLPAFRKYNRNG